ncbi:unnamed protein product, partial [Chrysoparadoxa australica]
MIRFFGLFFFSFSTLLTKTQASVLLSRARPWKMRFKPDTVLRQDISEEELLLGEKLLGVMTTCSFSFFSLSAVHILQIGADCYAQESWKPVSKISHCADDFMMGFLLTRARKAFKAYLGCRTFGA